MYWVTKTMITIYRASLWVVLLILLGNFMCAASLAAPDMSVGDEPVVSVVMDNNYPPFSFRDVNGNLVGISVDMWRLWEKQTGKKVAITGLEWDDALHRMETGEFDVIDTVFFSDERAKTYDFTPSYADVDVVIFFNADISGISSLESLDGFVVGMHLGDSTIKDVKNKGIQVREYSSYEAVVKAAKDGEIVVFILDKPSGVYYLYKQGIQDKFRCTSPILLGELHRAVKKGNSALLTEINQGFARIPQNEYDALDHKWYGTSLTNTEYLRFVVIFTGAVIFLIIILVVWNRTLKKKVAQKTAELNAELDQRKRTEVALKRATQKLGLLNAITFTDIQNAMFSLCGYLELEKQQPADEIIRNYREKEEKIIHTISASLKFAKNYQDLGIIAPAWQDVLQVFLLGISHIDCSKLSRNIQVDNLEIYADPLLEKVFLTLAENVLLHGTTATEISLMFKEDSEGLTLIFEDNGAGIPVLMKDKIFERRIKGKNGLGLFLAREILSITGITIKETGTEGTGARFEMMVPKGEYRFGTD
ncbi:MAG: transporter substrate-binding domain-containing protein [Methanoregula sp.]|nr:transporter substrate-binding domain-containing protein [Methanoregula sp.]